MSNIIDRIAQIAKNEGITISAMEQKIGASKGVLSRALAKGTDIQVKWMARVVENYPKYNRDWLLSGVLPMIKDEFTENNKTRANVEVIPVGKHAHSRLKVGEYEDAYPDWEGLPMYNEPITASFVASYRDNQIHSPQYYLRDPRFKDCDFGAVITGDSMHSEIRHGDFVACKEVTDPSFLVFGEIYYVVAKNGLETCKYINAGKDDEHVLLVPKNEKISPSPIKKEMIRSIFKVRGIVRGY